MSDTLKSILEMDKIAQNKISEAQEYRTRELAALNEKKARIFEEETEKVRQLAQQRSNRQKAAGEARIKKIHEKNEKIISAMNKLYEQKAEDWVEKIVKNVTEM